MVPARTYRPPRFVLEQRGGSRAGLAIEDRDLIAEADNLDGCMDVWAATMERMYPAMGTEDN